MGNEGSTTHYVFVPWWALPESERSWWITNTTAAYTFRRFGGADVVI